MLRRNTMLREIMAASSFTDILRDELRPVVEAEVRAEVKAEAKAEGQRELVQTMLESRFGELDPEEVEALKVAAEPALRALAMYITSDSRDKVRARLGLK
jgi:hypothetical protein